jgi:hypothetical protein
MSGRESTPLAFAIRAMTGPVIGEPSAFRATGTMAYSTPGRGTVRPA